MIRTATLKLRKGRRGDYSRLEEALNSCRLLYNAALEQRRDAFRKQRKSLSFFDQCKELTSLRAESEEFKLLDVTMTRLTSLKRLDESFKGFFRRLKRGEKPGFPRFKGRDRFDTLVFGTSGWKLSDGKLKLKGVGWFRVAGKLHREGSPKGLRLVKRADRWYAQVLLDVGEAPKTKTAKNGVGIDVGIKTFATMSDGSRIEHPRFLKKAAAKLRKAQQAVSRKRRGSARRRKARGMLRRLHAKIANQRKDFIWQSAAQLASEYDGFAVEDLDIREMASQPAKGKISKKGQRGLHRGIMDSAWGNFMNALACKAEEAGMPFMKVNPKGTTQRCSECGTLVRKALGDRVHECSACGLTIDRDENAARNIHDLGWRSTGGRTAGIASGSSACGESP